MDYWTVLARERARREIAAAVSPIMRPDLARAAGAADAEDGSLIAALRQTIEDQAAEIHDLKTELAALRHHRS